MSGRHVIAKAALVAFFLLSQAAPLPAAGLDIQLTVDRTEVALDGQLQVTVTVTSDGQAAIGEPAVEIPDAFDILGISSSSSTSIQFVNGAMTSTLSRSYVYTIQPSQLGPFTIGPARIEQGGSAAESSSALIEVVKATRSTRPSQSPAPATRARAAGTLQEMEENLFIRTIPDKKSVTVGEQVSVSYKLYTRYNIQQLEYNSLPAYTGFWAETTYEAPRAPHTTQEVVNGQTYSVIVLRTVALFPTTSGIHPLEQLELRCTIPVRRRSRSPLDLDDFFSFDPFGRSQQVMVRSEDVAVDVRPLPSGGPVHFEGTVGTYSIASTVKPTTVKAGDPVSVTVTVSGEGHLNSVSEPHHPEDPNFRFYDPQVTTETEIVQGHFGGTKSFEYVVIPKRSGQVALPTFTLTFFDPQASAYRTDSTQPTTLAVSPGEFVSTAPPGLSRQDIRLLGEDIRFIKPDRQQLVDGASVLTSGWSILAIQSVPVVAILLAFGFRRHQDRLAGDVAYARRRRASAEARRRLAEAQKLMAGDDQQLFYTELHRAAAQFLADRLNLPAAGLTPASAASALTSEGVGEDLVTRAQALMTTCDFARFAPTGQSEDDRTNLYDEAESLVDELGRVI